MELKLKVSYRLHNIGQLASCELCFLENWIGYILIGISEKAIIGKVLAKLNISLDLYYLLILLSIENFSLPIVSFINYELR